MSQRPWSFVIRDPDKRQRLSPLGYHRPMKLKEVMAKLKSFGDEKVYARNAKKGAGEDHFGVKMGDIRKVAKTIKSDHDLALELWGTGNLEARLLATLVLRPKDLTLDELDQMVREATFHWLADWINSYVVKVHPEREALREGWMDDEDPMAARAGWNLTAIRVAKDPDGLELAALLKRIEGEMAAAPEEAQWTMNICLVEIGIHFPKHRKRALAIGESLGIYRDLKAPKGCTSPFAPIWIQTMVARQG